MNRITEYMVVEEYGVRTVAARINQHIQDGWQPFGSLTVGHSNGVYSQPMVRYARPDAPVSAGELTHIEQQT